MRVSQTHLYFYGGPFSQWHYKPSLITEVKNGNNGEGTGISITKYSTAEQYMMAKKALLFKDYEIYTKILCSDNPKSIKVLGRKIKNFDQELWDKNKLDIVIQGNYLKFSQNSELLQELLLYKDLTIVEASPTDKIWGIGLSVYDDLILDEKNWQGENLLGKAIMAVREMILRGMND